ncbi:hypothetical protein [Rhizobium laguerreae]|uniref:hypothetical protein n=1 Tax=Rhizobium laguerreae TaxID=1076926 RepID=UPI001C921E5B|nr:hypothetical protein [Rhizobium laguerreae]MBY3231832.1 hypothetical protein [Rhizobium laguerreae]
MTIITDPKEGVMGAARAMVEILYDHMDRGAGRIDLPAFTLTWRLGEHRLGDSCKGQVLTIEDFAIHRGANRWTIARMFAATIIRGRYPMPRIPIAFLHYQAPKLALVDCLKALHFQPYRIGDRLDFWHVVDGQGELL